MTKAHINRIAVAVPQHEVHRVFVRFAEGLIEDRRARLAFKRMSARADIDRRWSCLQPANSEEGWRENDALVVDGFYAMGRFPGTAARMARFEAEAPRLALRAFERLETDPSQFTHLIVTTCTGFFAPGVDLRLIRDAGLHPSVERTIIGFMGCNAAINGLKLAHHIVRSRPEATVLLLSLELCTLHLQQTSELEQLLMFLLFGDGCAAAVVSSEPVGFAIDSFHAELAQEAGDHITWRVGDCGFEMMLSGQVPTVIGGALRAASSRILGGRSAKDIELWAIHPGGRTILDAAADAFALDPDALSASRQILRQYGNMSSPTVLFVLEALLRGEARRGAPGCAMAFGPGLSAETMLFHAVD